jgi:hypothetical protein
VLSAFFYGNGIRIDLVIRLLSDCNADFTYEDERSIRQRYRMFSVDRVLRSSSYYDLQVKYVLHLDGQLCQYTWYIGGGELTYGFDALSVECRAAIERQWLPTGPVL